MARRSLCFIGCCVLASASSQAQTSVVGIHWWGFSGSAASIDTAPHAMLRTDLARAWSTETINTHSVPWWGADYFRPLVDTLAQQNVNVITRVNYDWGQTVPAPATLGATGWAESVAQAVQTMRGGSRVFQLGNEPNLFDEGNGWIDRRITPTGYAQLYQAVASRLRTSDASPLGAYQLLVAAPSPGPIVNGVRWMEGTQWLGQTLDAMTDKTLVSGIALHGYGGSVGEFRRALAEQMAVIRSRGLSHVPVYITEFARPALASAADPDAQEAASAEFLRGAYAEIDRWNRVPGNQNIVAATWFVYDHDTYAGPGWRDFSIEYWRDHGHPPGDPRDLFTAFQDVASRGYRAGIEGSTPLPPGVRILDDFETGNGRFGSTLTASPYSSGFTSAVVSRDADDSHTNAYAQRLTIVDNPTNPAPWRVRHLSGGANPSNNLPIVVSDQTADGFVGIMLKSDTPGLTVQIVFDTDPANASTGLAVGAARSIEADGQWHLYEWDLDATDYQRFPGINGGGVIPANGRVWIDSILIQGVNANAVLRLDSIMHNANGSLQAMALIPEPAALLVPAAGSLLSLRRR